jgi:hypothetical protein
MPGGGGKRSPSNRVYMRGHSSRGFRSHCERSEAISIEVRAAMEIAAHALGLDPIGAKIEAHRCGLSPASCRPSTSPLYATDIDVDGPAKMLWGWAVAATCILSIVQNQPGACP